MSTNSVLLIGALYFIFWIIGGTTIYDNEYLGLNYFYFESLLSGKSLIRSRT